MLRTCFVLLLLVLRLVVQAEESHDPAISDLFSLASFSQLQVQVDPSFFEPARRRFVPMRTPAACFASYIKLEPNETNHLFTVDSMFFTILLTVVSDNVRNYNASNITETIYDKFVAQNETDELCSCLSYWGPATIIPLVNMTRVPRGGSVLARVPPMFQPAQSAVYEGLMKAIVAVSLALIVVQLYYYGKFLSSSMYKRLESHKRGGGANGTWKQKLLSTLFP